jgi:hypothetical protein
MNHHHSSLGRKSVINANLDRYAKKQHIAHCIIIKIVLQ